MVGSNGVWKHDGIEGTPSPIAYMILETSTGLHE